ncbi:hypothetical protein Hanom_Chr14g01315191 [Helianthus anomalus]
MLYGHIIIYIYMVPIKSNKLLNQFSPLDLAKIKSQPLKLTKIIAIVAVLMTVSS